MKYYSTLLLLLALMISVSCETDDNDTGATDPVIFIMNDEYSTNFHTPGESDTPTIEWNGSPGTFSITQPIEGLTINADSGKLSWDRTMPIGDLEVEIKATNREGKMSMTSITIHNMFAGTFIGGFNEDVNSNILSTEHTTIMRWDEPSDHIGQMGQIISTGMWTRNGSQVKWGYPLEDGRTIWFCATLVYDNSQAFLSGFISFTNDFTNPDGLFNLNRDY